MTQVRKTESAKYLDIDPRLPARAVLFSTHEGQFHIFCGVQRAHEVGYTKTVPALFFPLRFDRGFDFTNPQEFINKEIVTQMAVVQPFIRVEKEPILLERIYDPPIWPREFYLLGIEINYPMFQSIPNLIHEIPPQEAITVAGYIDTTNDFSSFREAGYMVESGIRKAREELLEFYHLPKPEG